MSVCGRIFFFPLIFVNIKVTSSSLKKGLKRNGIFFLSNVQIFNAPKPLDFKLAIKDEKKADFKNLMLLNAPNKNFQFLFSSKKFLKFLSLQLKVSLPKVLSLPLKYLSDGNEFKREVYEGLVVAKL